MKKWIVWPLLACLLLLSACSPTTAIAGTYTDEDGLVYYFAGDGTFSVGTEEAATSGTYTLADPNVITIAIVISDTETKSLVGTYKLEENVLTLTDADGHTDVLTRATTN